MHARMQYVENDMLWKFETCSSGKPAAGSRARSGFRACALSHSIYTHHICSPPQQREGGGGRREEEVEGSSGDELSGAIARARATIRRVVHIILLERNNDVG